MRTTIGKFIGIICLVAMAGCASASKHYTWQDINREVVPQEPKPEPEAYLKVYTEIEAVNDGDIQRYPHLPYTIFSAEGKKIKYVRNDDENPELVTLPPGKYVIAPEAWKTKAKIIGATLEEGRITEVHLKGGE
ncbi:MAG: hypothetical protein KGJ11_00290 [Candidatus Omnitrophica bacterium]|nr:hypothetical protein [Candidatus Omnitrophota bacterium]